MTVDYAYAEQVAQVAQIHLARPERLNAVTDGLVVDLLAAFAQARADDARVVVLAGHGRAFCAGHDLKEPVPVETTSQTRARLERLHDVTRTIRAFPGVVISAVQGYALGAGCEFALGCDLVVAGEDARFGFPEVSVGLSVTGGISALLPKVVGPYKAKELLLTGDRLIAEDAAALGLVNQVVPAGTHEQAALDLARTVAERPPTAAVLAKRVIDAGLDTTVDAAMATETEHALITSLSGEGEAPKTEFNA